MLCQLGTPPRFCVIDLARQTNLATINLLSVPGTVPRLKAGQWSIDSRFFVFQCATALVPQDGNGTNDVYLFDLNTLTPILVNANYTSTDAANGPSDYPVMGGNGRFIVFRSYATDIVPGLINRPALYVLDRATGLIRALSIGALGSDWGLRVARLSIAGQAATVAVQS